MALSVAVSESVCGVGHFHSTVDWHLFFDSTGLFSGSIGVPLHSMSKSLAIFIALHYTV
jgi:hypothetical protein